MRVKAYIPLAVRQAERATLALAQAKVDIAKLIEVERLSAKVLALVDMPIHEGAAPNYDGGSKPIKYSVWKRFLSDTIVTGYVLDTLDDSVQVYCVHCGLPTEAATAKPIGIGVITTYDETVTTFNKAASEWEEEDIERIRPAIHKGMGCVACFLAYRKAIADAKRLTTQIRYKVDGVFKTLYATDIRHGSSLLAEQMGRVELISCKQIPARQGFLSVSAKVREYAKQPISAKVIAQWEAERLSKAVKAEAIQRHTDVIMAKVLADNMAWKLGNRRKLIKTRLAVFANTQPVRDWRRVAAITQSWEQ